MHARRVDPLLPIVPVAPHPSQDACSFNGVWRGKPSGMARAYYVSSYFWDRALDAGIIADKAAIEWRTTPGVRVGVRDGGCARSSWSCA